jgi:hypothetical protein
VGIDHDDAVASPVFGVPQRPPIAQPHDVIVDAPMFGHGLSLAGRWRRLV